MKKVVLLGLTVLATQSHAVVLYDAASGLRPDTATWGWTYGAVGGTVTPPAGGVLGLDTNLSPSIQAGWGRTAPIALDAIPGYTVRFTARVLSESHSSSTADKNGDGLADRAGFSLFALGSDKKGVELAFWTNQIFAQQDVPLFVQDPTKERVAFDTTGNGGTAPHLTEYALRVSGNQYTLSADGTFLFGGLLKDYTAFSGPIDPYETPNSLFFGDNTSSASAQFQLGRITLTPVPEPSAWLALAGGVGFLGLRRRR